MRGSAVPTIVWSRAAKKRASPTPMVARMRAFRVISPGIGDLLVDGIDRFVEVRQSGTQTCALLHGNAREERGYAALHDLAVLVELAAPLRGELHEDDPPIAGVLEAPDEPFARQRVHEFGERRCGHGAALGKIAAPHRALAK